MIQQKTEAVAPIVRIAPNPKSPGLLIVTVRCPFCGVEHGHGMTRGDALLGVALHRGADSCWPFGMELGRKGLRHKRRQQLEEGKAMRVRCGGGYSIPLSIPLYARYRKGRLVGLRLGEMKEMRAKASASQGRAQA